MDHRMSENKNLQTLPEQPRPHTPKSVQKNNDIDKMKKQFESQKINSMQVRKHQNESIKEHVKFDLNIKNL